MNGKGDKRRPTDEKKFSDNWDRIFNKRDKQPQQQPVQPIQEELKRQAQDRRNG